MRVLVVAPSEGHTDELLTTDGGNVRGGAIESDFELTWARADEVVMVNGTRAAVSDEEIVRTVGPTAWTHVRKRDGRWIAEPPCVG
jgi:hypothetical protein